MILTNRLFERKPPSREAKSIYIFCEGAEREFRYFEYFKEMDSRINIVIYKLDSNENNSPFGLYEVAKNSILETENNPNPRFSILPNDEVWIVVDKDPDKVESRKVQIDSIRNDLENITDWYLAESNPCFEVWLYYHMNKDLTLFEGSEYCKNWKSHVNNSIKGGFDSRKHPIFIEEAIVNSETNFQLDENNNLKIGSTEVFKLAKSMNALLHEKIKSIKSTFKV